MVELVTGFERALRTCLAERKLGHQLRSVLLLRFPRVLKEGQVHCVSEDSHVSFDGLFDVL